MKCKKTYKPRSVKVPAIGLLASAILLATNANAVAFKLLDNNLSATWNNTIKYNASWRLKEVDEQVASSGLANPNIDGGDHNFDKGLVSNRIDVFSELDVSYKRFIGFRLSVAGWYDDVYQDSTDNTGAGLSFIPNVLGTPNTEFSKGTKDIHGNDVEILDAFVSLRGKAGKTRYNLKVGQFAQLYGESLFFGGNGVADAQAIPDIAKALSVPGTPVKEIIRPTEQIALSLQFTPQLSWGGYYMFDWDAAQLPGPGSYFSFADQAGEGANVLHIPGMSLNRVDDLEGDDGEWGMQFKYKSDDSEFGAYASLHHARTPQFYIRPDSGDYSLVYAQNIEIYGLSYTTLVGPVSFAAEYNYRPESPLQAPGNVMVDDGTHDNDNNVLYPVGKTSHLNLSAISLFPANPLWDGASVVAEFAYNTVHSIHTNKDMLDPNSDRSSSAVRVLLTPEYFQVLPGWDLAVPINIGYGIHGNSAVVAGGVPPTHGGDISIGLKADVRKTWQLSLNYTHFAGEASGIVKPIYGGMNLSYEQLFADRDFISFTAQRTF